MLYPDVFKRLESARWNLNDDIDWKSFDPEKITDRQLHGIKMNAILEWSSMPTAEMFLRDAQDDIDFSAFVSIWFFEEQKHSLVLFEYLRRFAPDYLPTPEELAAVRFPFDRAPFLESLTLHFCGEVRLNQWYRCASEYHTEPLIKSIYLTMANDEARHARVYLDYMKKMVAQQKFDASLAFSKIAVLMTNARLKKAMHPTNLHVNKELYPNDTVMSRLPDPSWINIWLNDEIVFDEQWEKKVEDGIIHNISGLLNLKVNSSAELRKYRKKIELNVEQA